MVMRLEELDLTKKRHVGLVKDNAAIRDEQVRQVLGPAAYDSSVVDNPLCRHGFSCSR